MLFKRLFRQRPDSQIVVAEPAARPTENAEDAARRQLYARIAEGNALAEAEDDARRQWRGRG
jgi:hypothetical protein